MQYKKSDFQIGNKTIRKELEQNRIVQLEGINNDHLVQMPNN